MKKFILLSFLFISTSIVFTSCDDDDDIKIIAPTMDIVEIAQANGFTSLAAALTRAELVGALQGSGKFTVFAPTNAAFENLLSAINKSKEKIAIELKKKQEKLDTMLNLLENDPEIKKRYDELMMNKQ